MSSPKAENYPLPDRPFLSIDFEALPAKLSVSDGGTLNVEMGYFWRVTSRTNSEFRSGSEIGNGIEPTFELARGKALDLCRKFDADLNDLRETLLAEFSHRILTPDLARTIQERVIAWEIRQITNKSD